MDAGMQSERERDGQHPHAPQASSVGRHRAMGGPRLSKLVHGTAVVLTIGLLPLSSFSVSAQEAATPTTTNGDYVLTAAPQAPGADTDGDGLTNQFEASFGGMLNPNDSDTDHDNLRDGDEFNNRYGVTYPNVWDSDGDGLGDGQEVFGYYGYVTRADVWDTDRDGRSDGAEIFDNNPRTSPVVFEP